MTSPRNLVAKVRAELAANANPEKAPQMQTYMKSAMPFYGVQTPNRRAVLRPIFAAHRFVDRKEYESAVLMLWRHARMREERYAALDLTGHQYYREFQDSSALAMYEEFVTTGAWWDLVDETASRRIGPILRANPKSLAQIMHSWANDSDMWKRRTSIICQLGSKDDTDLDLLTYSVEANLTDQEFFIRKAIGWALREYAKTDPAWVRKYVATNAKALSPLSKREAIKNL